MKVNITSDMRVAIRTLSEEDQPIARAWLARLEHWDTDTELHAMTKPSYVPGTLALTTTDDLRIFFQVDEANQEIMAVDLMKPSRYPRAFGGVR